MIMREKSDVCMKQQYVYRMPDHTLVITNSRNLEWEMSDDHVYLKDVEITRKYKGEDNLRAVVNGQYIYNTKEEE
jgi:hypothetical protein